jgi:hypothetical protein
MHVAVMVECACHGNSGGCFKQKMVAFCLVLHSCLLATQRTVGKITSREIMEFSS